MISYLDRHTPHARRRSACILSPLLTSSNFLETTVGCYWVATATLACYILCGSSHLFTDIYCNSGKVIGSCCHLSADSSPVPQVSVKSILFCRFQIHMGFLGLFIFFLFYFCKALPLCSHNLILQVSNHLLRVLILENNKINVKNLKDDLQLHRSHL